MKAPGRDGEDDRSSVPSICPVGDDSPLVPAEIVLKGVKMAKVEKSAEFHAPVEKVFNLVTDITTWPQWVPPMTSVGNISGSGMGTTYNWEFKLGSLPALKGEGEITKLIPNRRVEIRTRPVASTWTFAFANRGDKTIITLSIEYDIPGGGLAAGLVNSQIEESIGLLRDLLE